MEKRDFLRVWDLSREETENILGRGLELKNAEKLEKSLKDKIVALVFEKPSTRTRVSFEAAATRLGATSLYLSSRDLQLSRGEPIKDTARVLSRYVDCVVIRTFSQHTLEEFAKFSRVPVINGLSDMFHPCQALSDVMTVMEKGIDLKTSKVAWIGDGNNVCHSWIEVAALLGFEFAIACPEGFEPDSQILETAKRKFNANIWITHDPKEAVKGARVVNTDVWVSMGQEEEARKRLEVFKEFQVNEELMSLAEKDAIFLHCLPAHRGEEVTEEVLEGPRSVVWDQAENKMWLHMALLEFLLG